MIILDYEKGIHPDCGKVYEVHKDIIITPFWTEEFCKQLVDACEFYKDRFRTDLKWGGVDDVNAWKDLALNHISDVTFYYYCKHYKQRIFPLLDEVYGKGVQIYGWFTPQILKYETPGSRVREHYDVSTVTLNVKMNNDYQGCELVFPRQKFDSSIVPVGHAMIWPSLVTHPHFSNPLVSGTKYSFSSWTWPPKWSPTDSGSIANTDGI